MGCDVRFGVTQGLALSAFGENMSETIDSIVRQSLRGSGAIGTR